MHIKTFDFISAAELANIPAIPPFLQPSAKFINGANFASAGAGILSETNQGLVSVFLIVLYIHIHILINAELMKLFFYYNE